MKVVIKKVGQPAFVEENFENTLKSLQRTVGGYIECLYMDMFLCPECPDPGIVMVINEEGKLKNLPLNFPFMDDIILGDVVFVNSKEENFISLTETQVKFLLDIF